MFFKNESDFLYFTEDQFDHLKGLDQETLEDYLDFISQEISIEDILTYKASATLIMSSLLGMRNGHRKWLLITGLTGLELLKGTLTDWSMYRSILKRFGFRSQDEIYTEMAVIQYLLGDFDVLDHDAVDLGRS